MIPIILALTIDMQAVLFSAFEELLDQRIEGAIAAGVYDLGLETLRAQFGVKEDSVWATIQDNNDVLVIHHFDTEEQADAFLSTDELKGAMEALGVIEAPKLQIFNRL